MRRQDVTYAYKIGELRLDIPHPNNQGQVFVFVEGESDVKLFRKLFASTVNIERIPGGNVKVEQAVQDLQTLSSLLIGIRDADFIRLLRNDYQEDPIFLTDGHDVEMMMLSDNEVLNSLLNEYIEGKLTVQAQDIRDIVKVLLKDLSLVKLINAKNNYQMSFKGSFDKFVNIKEKIVDLKAIIDTAIQRGGTECTIDSPSVLEKLAIYQKQSLELTDLLNGHDVANLLKMLFNENRSSKKINLEQVESNLRVAYTFTSTPFQKTQLYQKLQNWQQRQGVNIFPN